jgi:hypothetical protein
MTTNLRFVVVTSLVWAIFICLIAIAFAAPARAEPRAPLPVPQLSTGCPPGYSSSPTSGFCVPGATTKQRAVPKVGVGCPAGFSESPTSGYCVEIGR